MTYAMVRPAGFSEAGKRIHEAGLRFARANPHAEETASQRKARLAVEARVAGEAAAAAERARIRAEIWALKLKPIADRVQGALDEDHGPCRVKDIVFAAGQRFGIPYHDLMSDRRPKPVSLARHVAMYLAYDLSRCSLPEIGRRMGGKDHTSVLHGIRRVAALIAAGDPIAADIDAIRKKLTEPGQAAA